VTKAELDYLFSVFIAPGRSREARSDNPTLVRLVRLGLCTKKRIGFFSPMSQFTITLDGRYALVIERFKEICAEIKGKDVEIASLKAELRRRHQESCGALAESKGGEDGQQKNGSSKWGSHFPSSSCTSYEDCCHDGACHDQAVCGIKGADDDDA